MFNGYTKMRLLDALIGRILDIHQTHWTQTHQTHFITALVCLSMLFTMILICKNAHKVLQTLLFNNFYE